MLSPTRKRISDGIMNIMSKLNLSRDSSTEIEVIVFEFRLTRKIQNNKKKRKEHAMDFDFFVNV